MGPLASVPPAPAVNVGGGWWEPLARSHPLESRLPTPLLRRSAPPLVGGERRAEPKGGSIRPRFRLTLISAFPMLLPLTISSSRSQNKQRSPGPGHCAAAVTSVPAAQGTFQWPPGQAVRRQGRGQLARLPVDPGRSAGDVLGPPLRRVSTIGHRDAGLCAASKGRSPPVAPSGVLTRRFQPDVFFFPN